LKASQRKLQIDGTTDDDDGSTTQNEKLSVCNGRVIDALITSTLKSYYELLRSGHACDCGVSMTTTKKRRNRRLVTSTLKSYYELLRSGHACDCGVSITTTKKRRNRRLAPLKILQEKAT
jgi:hypothetical protein